MKIINFNGKETNWYMQDLDAYNSKFLRWIIADLDEKLKDLNKELDANEIYPTDIFPEIAIDNLKEIINNHLKTNFNFSFDRLSAHILREFMNNLRRKLE